PQVINIADLVLPQHQIQVPVVPEPRRNIFAYYEPVQVKVEVPPPTPTPPPPPPPVLLAAISPSNVYAKTTEFTMELSGDKFTPEMRVYVDERELPTKYKGPQQMSATIGTAIIATPGIRQFKVRTPDGRVYSNQIQLSVAPPPTPNYAYVGIWGTRHYVNTALLQDKNNKEILSVQLGDLLSGRFRVTSISDKEIVFVDTNLKIKHSLAMTEGERTAGSPIARPTPRVDSEDDEP
ncbi:MAG TPA: TIG domain-containing protein, partial [Pyrinomonadaceae bacterium]